jgi:hypothetical protein
MSYMLLIVEPLHQRRVRSPDEGRGVYQRMLDYTETLKRQGVLLASNSLREAAVRLNVRGGRPTLVDGPFTEAKEFVGGFFLLDCGTREHALQLAGECPAAEWATIEVREIGPCYD